MSLGELFDLSKPFFFHLMAVKGDFVGSVLRKMTWFVWIQIRGGATHSSILAWNIPWMEEPGRLLSTGLQRVRLD